MARLIWQEIPNDKTKKREFFLYILSQSMEFIVYEDDKKGWSVTGQKYYHPNGQIGDNDPSSVFLYRGGFGSVLTAMLWCEDWIEHFFPKEFCTLKLRHLV